MEKAIHLVSLLQFLAKAPNASFSFNPLNSQTVTFWCLIRNLQHQKGPYRIMQDPYLLGVVMFYLVGTKMTVVKQSLAVRLSNGAG